MIFLTVFGSLCEIAYGGAEIVSLAKQHIVLRKMTKKRA